MELAKIMKVVGLAFQEANTVEHKPLVDRACLTIITVTLQVQKWGVLVKVERKPKVTFKYTLGTSTRM